MDAHDRVEDQRLRYKQDVQERQGANKNSVGYDITNFTPRKNYAGKQ